MVNGSNSQDSQLIKILFLAANPTQTDRLRLDEECRKIREKLQLGKLRDSFHLETRHAVRVEDITQAIFDVEPNIIHFSGHGTGEDGLVFEDSNGNPFSVESDTLAEIFELLKNQVNCVVLNACFSEIQAEAIAEHISFVIGMNNSIGDEAAIAFSSGFYKALVGNRSFEDSFKFGCIEIKYYKIPENLTPVLYKKKLKTPGETNKEKVFLTNRVDYTSLVKMLEAKEWQKADKLTAKLMQRAVGQEGKRWLQIEDIQCFPCGDLYTINELWEKYSQGHFGFSVQKQIWQEVGGKSNLSDYELYQVYIQFTNRVGWRVDGKFLSQVDIAFTGKSVNYSQNAPKGHLPFDYNFIGDSWMGTPAMESALQLLPHFSFPWTRLYLGGKIDALSQKLEECMM